MEPITLTELKAERLRRNFSGYIKGAWKVVEPHVDYIHNWHIDLISEYLTAVTIGDIKRLIINICPRIGKSRQITTCWPTWEWITYPEMRYLFSSYSGNLARDHSRERRMIIESDWYRERWGDRFDLMTDQNAVTYFANSKGGRMQSRGTGGSGTGKGGNRVVVDDPHNVKQSDSQTQREQALHDFDKNLSTRLDDPNTGAIVIVMQRLHYNDLTGHILEDIGGYELVTLETIATERKIITFPLTGKEVVREKDTVLFPSRQGDDFIQEQKRTLGTFGFEAQHQQNPMPEGGNHIRMDWFGRYGIAPVNITQCVQSWDTGNKPGRNNDPTVCLTFVESNKLWYLIDIYRNQIGYPELKKKFINQFIQHKPNVVLVEDKASGTSLIQEMRAEHREIPVIPIEPESDKQTRMETQSPHVEAGHIVLPHQATWLQDFEKEIMRFPDPMTWDQIDAFSQFLKYIYGRKREVKMRTLSGL